MQNRFELPVFITNTPSVWLLCWICLIHLGVIPVLPLSALPGWVVVAVIPAIIASLCFALRKHVFLNSMTSVVRLFLNGDEEWWLTNAHGRTLKVRLVSPTLVHPLLTILRFRADRNRYTLILTADTAPPDEFRRLRVRLRFRKQDSNED